MRVLVASDKFKGSLTASEACASISAGLSEALPAEDLEIRSLPIADGGDGIAETLCSALEGRWREVNVTDPLGETVLAGYTMIDGGKTAVIEMARASGLALLGSRAKDPLRASTFGTGELILDAMNEGVSEIILGIGGSATNDGGTGMALALGFRFLNEKGDDLSDLPAELTLIQEIVAPELHSLPRITVACDVVNPLLGPNGCTAIYGPQKGISKESFALHESRLAHLVSLLGAHGEKSAKLPGAGAAGGLGFGAMVFLGAGLVPGFDLVAEKLNLEEAVSWADLVITGEGRIDLQSLQGKGPFGVVGMAKRHRKPTAAFCGSLGEGDLESVFGPLCEIRDPSLDLSENMSRGAELLRLAARDFSARLKQHASL